MHNKSIGRKTSCSIHTIEDDAISENDQNVASERFLSFWKRILFLKFYNIFYEQFE